MIPDLLLENAVKYCTSFKNVNGDYLFCFSEPDLEMFAAQVEIDVLDKELLNKRVNGNKITEEQGS